MNDIKFQMGEYNEDKSDTAFKLCSYNSIDEAIANIEFLKLAYNFFSDYKALAVRLEEGSQVHLIDLHTVEPILEFKKELIQKYNLQNTFTDEDIEFIVQERTTDHTLNSNFEFKEDSDTRYAKTSTGEELPFQLFHSDDTDTGSNLLRRKDDTNESTDFALIERRFTENNSLKFYGTEKIESHNDIAWLFKSLEDESVEHAFLVYHFQDKGYFVQHLSTGTYNAALVENKMFIGNVLAAKPSSVTLVHNHPSGNLKASKQDFAAIEKLTNALQFTDIEVNPGVIINLRSGKYLVMEESDFNAPKERTFTFKPFNEIQAYSFSKQILVQNYQPHKVESSHDVAAFISSQKFGVSDKTEMLILNAQLHIVAKLILPPNNIVEFITTKITQFGGHNCILYGNNISARQINFYNSRLQHCDLPIMDGILLKSDNAEKIYTSFRDENLLDADKLNEKIVTKFENMENNKLFAISEFDRFENRGKTLEFSSTSDTVRYINNLDFSAKKTYALVDLKTGKLSNINNSSQKEKAVSDFWAKELSAKTDLSAGLNLTQVDEKQAEHFRNYESLIQKTDNPHLTQEEITEAIQYKKADSQNIIDEAYKKATDPDSNSLTSFGKDSNFIDDIFDDIENRNGDLWKKNDIEVIGGKIKDIAAEAIGNPDSLKPFDQNTQNVIHVFNQNQNFDVDQGKITKAKNLPEGWMWRDYEDGSGSLKSPEGKSYFGYDLETNEYKLPTGNNDWTFIFEKNFSDFKIKAENDLFRLIQINKIDLINPKLSTQEVKNLEKHFEQLNININNQNPTIMANEDFKIADLNITPEQIASYANYYEYGVNDGQHGLTEEQKSKIPDEIEGRQLDSGDKMLLALGTLDFPIYGISYAIEDNAILKTSLNEELVEIKENLKVSDIKFNNQNPKIMDQNQNKQEKANQELAIGRYANIKDSEGNLEFKGTIKNIGEFEVTLENKVGEEHSAPKEQVYQYFYGQKHDLSEVKDMLQNRNLPAGLTLENLSSKDLTQLMKGEQTDTLFKGVKKEEGKEPVDYEFKLILRYDSKEKKVIPQPEWKSKDFNLSESKIFGQDLPAEDRQKLEKGEKIVMSTEKGEKPMNFRVVYDEKLNSIVSLGLTNLKPEVKEKEVQNEVQKQNKKKSSTQKI